MWTKIEIDDNFCFEKGDILHVATGDWQEFYQIADIKGTTLFVILLKRLFILEEQFNNVLFKMWER